MTSTIYYEADISLSPLQQQSLTLFGYGNQGRPQALNLRDSGVLLRVALSPNSARRSTAERDGFQVISFSEAAQTTDILMILLPDDVMASVYQREIQPHLRPGQTLGFCHGLTIHAGWIQPAQDINVFLLAPKAQGRGVRNKYLLGSGVPGLYCVHQDPSQTTLDIALAYGKGLGCARLGLMPTSFREETECDLFSEQAVLCGGLTRLITTAFETLVNAGYSETVAYFECLYEVKLIADLLHEKGISGMREAISSTALFGDLSRGDRIIDGHVRANMEQILAEIQSGQFITEMAAEFSSGRKGITERLMHDYHHPIDWTHRRLTSQS